MHCLKRLSSFRYFSVATVAALLLSSLVPVHLLAQTSSSSSSSSSPDSGAANTTPLPRIAQPEVAGSAVTLEDSEPLFYIATSLNVCGYDTGVADSNPVRVKIRSEINDELAASEPARTSRDALCTFIREHALTDASRSLAQYVSLALFVTPPPELTITVDETELPPDANQVVGVLPLVRAFSDAVHLNALWSEHRAEYEGLIDRLPEPLRDLVLATNV